MTEKQNLQEDCQKQDRLINEQISQIAQLKEQILKKESQNQSLSASKIPSQLNPE